MIQPDLVKSRVQEKDLFMKFEIEDSEPHDGSTCEDHVVHLIHEGLIESLSTEGGLEGEPILREYKVHILVEVIAH